jgi:hypothetical protein
MSPTLCGASRCQLCDSRAPLSAPRCVSEDCSNGPALRLGACGHPGAGRLGSTVAERIDQFGCEDSSGQPARLSPLIFRQALRESPFRWAPHGERPCIPVASIVRAPTRRRRRSDRRRHRPGSSRERSGPGGPASCSSGGVDGPLAVAQRAGGHAGDADPDPDPLGAAKRQPHTRKLYALESCWQAGVEAAVGGTGLARPARSRAMSVIMSSWPPTSLRRPASSSIVRTSMP